jgi:hypothetical protein
MSMSVGESWRIVADLDTGLFCVEGPMTDDQPWQRAVQRALQKLSATSKAARRGGGREAAARRLARAVRLAGAPNIATE